MIDNMLFCVGLACVKLTLVNTVSSLSMLIPIGSSSIFRLEIILKSLSLLLSLLVPYIVNRVVDTFSISVAGAAILQSINHHNDTWYYSQHS